MSQHSISFAPIFRLLLIPGILIIGAVASSSAIGLPVVTVDPSAEAPLTGTSTATTTAEPAATSAGASSALSDLD